MECGYGKQSKTIQILEKISRWYGAGLIVGGAGLLGMLGGLYTEIIKDYTAGENMMIAGGIIAGAGVVYTLVGSIISQLADQMSYDLSGAAKKDLPQMLESLESTNEESSM